MHVAHTPCHRTGPHRSNRERIEQFPDASWVTINFPPYLFKPTALDLSNFLAHAPQPYHRRVLHPGLHGW